MDPTMFFYGFGVAGVVGWLSGRIVSSWNAVGANVFRMFSLIPQPALRPIPGAAPRGIGTDPSVSPIQILRDGCLSIIGYVITQIVLIISLGIVIWFNSRLEITQEFLVGILFAMIIGFLLNQIRINWAYIVTLWNLIINPPIPGLSLATQPNNRTLTARPQFPAFTVVFDSIMEISWRLVWHLILLFLLLQSFVAAYFYLREGAIRFLGGETFGT